MFGLVIVIMSVILYIVIGVTMFSIVAPRIAWGGVKKSRYKTHPDTSDIIDGQFGGGLLSGLWPLSLPGMAVYFTTRRACLAIFKVIRKDDFWDEPKPIQSPLKTYRENKMVKREQQVTQQREAVTEQRKIINAREAELGFDLTKWDDFPVNN